MCIRDSNVSILGKRSDVMEILLDSDVFAFPTLHENLSNSLLEACSVGLAIVATNVGGNPEVIENNVTGLLVPSKDPVSLSNALRRLILDNNLREILGAKAKENVENNFNAKLIFNQLGEAYDSLLK